MNFLHRDNYAEKKANPLLLPTYRNAQAWLYPALRITSYNVCYTKLLRFGALGMRGNFYYGASVKYDSIVDNSMPKVLPEVAEIDTSKVEIVTEKEENENIKQMRREVENSYNFV